MVRVKRDGKRRRILHSPFDPSPHERLPEFPGRRKQIVSLTQGTQVLLTPPSSFRVRMDVIDLEPRSPRAAHDHASRSRPRVLALIASPLENTLPRRARNVSRKMQAGPLHFQ